MAFRKKTITQRVVSRAQKLGVKVYERNQWGSKYNKVYHKRRKSRPVRVKKASLLVVHITVTKDTGLGDASFFSDMRTIERIGIERFGSGVSYNFCIDNSRGYVGVGQALDAKGTHTVNKRGVRGYPYDLNHFARAIAWIAMPGDQFKFAARDSMVRLIAAMVLEGALTENFEIAPHSKFAAKDCPTDAVRKELVDIKSDAVRLARQERANYG